MRALAVLGLFCTAAAAAADFDHSAWDRVLKRHVNARGEIDYAGIQKDRRDMDAYLALLRASSPKSNPGMFSTRADAMAYWINAYNAFVTNGVAVKYPVKSVRDLGFAFGFFRAREYVAGGTTMSLNNVEHDTLRKEFNDPRVHFAIVCASLGCPYLARDAFLPRKLEEQLDAGARQFVGEDRNVSIDPGRNEVVLSKIFDWYAGDFGGKGKLVEYVQRYSTPARREALARLKNPRLRFRDYDWGINDPGSRK